MANINKDLISGQVFEDIGPRPIRVKNRRHLAEVCEQHGVYSHYLENCQTKNMEGAEVFIYDKKLGKVVKKKRKGKNVNR